jgi:hypothetical protein
MTPLTKQVSLNDPEGLVSRFAGTGQAHACASCSKPLQQQLIDNVLTDGAKPGELVGFVRCMRTLCWVLNRIRRERGAWHLSAVTPAEPSAS